MFLIHQRVSTIHPQKEIETGREKGGGEMGRERGREGREREKEREREVGKRARQHEGARERELTRESGWRTSNHCDVQLVMSAFQMCERSVCQVGSLVNRVLALARESGGLPSTSSSDRTFSPAVCCKAIEHFQQLLNFTLRGKEAVISYKYHLKSRSERKASFSLIQSYLVFDIFIYFDLMTLSQTVQSFEFIRIST